MRWIACCLVAACVGLGLSVTLIRHFGSQPSDPNLAELGLSEDLDQLAAPEEPEPAKPIEPPHVLTVSEAIETAAGPMPTVPKANDFSSDLSLRPVTFIDSAAAVALDDRAREWMPLCKETGRCEATGVASALDRMPRCDELAPVVQKQPTLKTP